MKKILLTTFAVLVAVMGFASSANAIQNLEVGLLDPYAVGDIINGFQGNGGQAARDVSMVNNLLRVEVGESEIILDPNATASQLYERSDNDFGTLPDATATGSVIASGTGLNNQGSDVLVTITGSSYQYLVAAYDGPNGGVQVWNISSFAAGTTFAMPRYAAPKNDNDPLPDEGPLTEGNKYQMTGWTLLNPGTSVPDSGLTLALMGLALMGLEGVRRKVRR